MNNSRHDKNGSDFRLVDIKALSEILSLSESSIRHHVRCGRITPIRSLGRRVMFDLERVREEITRGHEPPRRSIARSKAKALPRTGKQLFEMTDEVGFSEKEKTK